MSDHSKATDSEADLKNITHVCMSKHFAFQYKIMCMPTQICKNSCLRHGEVCWVSRRGGGGLSLSFLVVPSRLSLGKGSGERMAGPCFLLTHEHPRNNFNCRGSMHGINNVIHIYLYIILASLRPTMHLTNAMGRTGYTTQ